MCYVHEYNEMNSWLQSKKKTPNTCWTWLFKRNPVVQAQSGAYFKDFVEGAWRGGDSFCVFSCCRSLMFLSHFPLLCCVWHWAGCANWRAKSYDPGRDGKFSAALLDCDAILFIFQNWEFLWAKDLTFGCTVFLWGGGFSDWFLRNYPTWYLHVTGLDLCFLMTVINLKFIKWERGIKISETLFMFVFHENKW